MNCARASGRIIARAETVRAAGVAAVAMGSPGSSICRVTPVRGRHGPQPGRCASLAERLLLQVDELVIGDLPLIVQLRRPGDLVRGVRPLGAPTVTYHDGRPDDHVAEDAEK